MDINYLYTPKYFDMLVSSTGQLSGDKRFRRIVEIGEKNIWLAAKCKNTCVNEEPEIVDWIIRRCSILYQKFSDLQSIIALFELREYGVLGHLLGLVYKKGVLNKTIVKLMNKPVGFSDAFSEIVGLLDFGFGLKLFLRFMELGYIFDVHPYNKLIAMAKSEEDVRELISMMTSSGVEANAITYYYLLKRERTYNSAIYYFSLFKKNVDIISQRELVEDAYCLMLNKCDNGEDLQTLYDDYKSFYHGENYTCRFNESYYGQKILVCDNEEEVKSLFESYVNKILEQIKEEKENPSIKRTKIKKKIFFISNLSKYYIRRLSKSSMSYEEFIKILKELLNLIVVQLKARVPSLDYSITITTMMIRENSFAKGKEMVKLMHDYNQKLLSFCFERLLCLAKEKEDIDFVVNDVKCRKIKPQYIVSFIKCRDIEMVLYLYECLMGIGYPMNTFIYNAIIKGDTFQHSFNLINQMLADGLLPDIQTIQPLLRKWETVDDLANIMLLATQSNVDADERSILGIVKRATELKLESDIIDFYYGDDRRLNNKLSISWKQAIIKACDAFI